MNPIDINIPVLSKRLILDANKISLIRDDYYSYDISVRRELSERKWYRPKYKTIRKYIYQIIIEYNSHLSYTEGYWIDDGQLQTHIPSHSGIKCEKIIFDFNKKEERDKELSVIYDDLKNLYYINLKPKQ